MYGLDIDYRSDLPRLTKWLDKLPFYSTKEMSSITAYAEGAVLKPGHAPQIGRGNGGQIYIDDFEGTRSSIDLRFPLISWNLASTPQMFPESALNNGPGLWVQSRQDRLVQYRTRIAGTQQHQQPPAYQPGPSFPNRKPARYSTGNLPQRTNDFGQGLLTTFDIAFYPRDKGPIISSRDQVASRPMEDWSIPNRPGEVSCVILTRSISKTGNVEFIEFWLMDPFIKIRPTPVGGQLYINLGNISGRHSQRWQAGV